MRKIEVVKIDTSTNSVLAMDAYGRSFTWDLLTEALPQYINEFIRSAKVTCFGSLVVYRQDR